MTNDDLLISLALQAVEDDDAWQVFEDLVIERGLGYRVSVDSPRPVVGWHDEVRGWTLGHAWVLLDGVEYDWGFRNEDGTGSTMRALAAVLLFRGWDGGVPWPWPVVRKAMPVAYALSDLSGSRLDMTADHIYGLRRIEVGSWIDRESDEALRARCRGRISALTQ